ncbi:hypothetical protein GCM10020000_45550 [Streptomyces olivoverticillatus]
MAAPSPAYDEMRIMPSSPWKPSSRVPLEKVLTTDAADSGCGWEPRATTRGLHGGLSVLGLPPPAEPGDAFSIWKPATSRGPSSACRS